MGRGNLYELDRACLSFIHRTPYDGLWRENASSEEHVDVIGQTFRYAAKGQEIHVWEAGPTGEIGVTGAFKPASRVMNYPDLSYAENMYRDSDTPNHICGNSSASISENVGAAHFEAQSSNKIQPGIHAGDDREPH
jgi:hypothetical protein